MPAKLIDKLIAFFSKDYTYAAYSGSFKIRYIEWLDSNELVKKTKKALQDALDKDAMYQTLLEISKQEYNKENAADSSLLKYPARDVMREIRKVLYHEIFIDILRDNGYNVVAADRYLDSSNIDNRENIKIE